MKKSLEGNVSVEENIRIALTRVRDSFSEPNGEYGNKKYRFSAISNEGDYPAKVSEILKEYPLLNLVSVFALPHIPKGDYHLYAFRLNKQGPNKKESNGR
ncbi:MAG: hypothetical protein ABIH28_01165 [archaeon]